LSLANQFGCCLPSQRVADLSWSFVFPSTLSLRYELRTKKPSNSIGGGSLYGGRARPPPFGRLAGPCPLCNQPVSLKTDTCADENGRLFINIATLSTLSNVIRLPHQQLCRWTTCLNANSRTLRLAILRGIFRRGTPISLKKAVPTITSVATCFVFRWAAETGKNTHSASEQVRSHNELAQLGAESFGYGVSTEGKSPARLSS
jgi:hypothetical protein